MRTRLAAIDWKFWLSLTLAMCVAYLAFIGYAAVQDGREKDRQIDALIRTADERDRADARRDAQASRERIAAAEAQEALLAYTRSLANRQRAVLAYLREHGIELPVRLVRVIPAPVIAGADDNSASGSRKARPRAGTSDRSRKTADGPGKSEDAPGRGRGRGNR